MYFVGEKICLFRTQNAFRNMSPMNIYIAKPHSSLSMVVPTATTAAVYEGVNKIIASDIGPMTLFFFVS